MLDAQPCLGFTKGASTANGDVFIDTPAGSKGIIFDKVTWTNASANLSTSTATSGLYTAASAGGTAIVTAATGNLTPLTAASKYKDGTIAASADALTISQQTSGTYAGRTGVFLNFGGTNNVPATVDVYLYGRVLT
jgi:hypothetical protein